MDFLTGIIIAVTIIFMVLYSASKRASERRMIQNIERQRDFERNERHMARLQENWRDEHD